MYSKREERSRNKNITPKDLEKKKSLKFRRGEDAKFLIRTVIDRETSRGKQTSLEHKMSKKEHERRDIFVRMDIHCEGRKKNLDRSFLTIRLVRREIEGKNWDGSRVEKQQGRLSFSAFSFKQEDLRPIKILPAYFVFDVKSHRRKRESSIIAIKGMINWKSVGGRFEAIRRTLEKSRGRGKGWVGVRFWSLLCQPSHVYWYLLLAGVSEIIMNLFVSIARRRYFIVPGRECGLNF